MTTKFFLGGHVLITAKDLGLEALIGNVWGINRHFYQNNTEFISMRYKK